MIERVNYLIGEINSVSRDLMAERTHYSSQLIPVSAYVVLSTVEAFLRYPDIVKSIVQAMPPEEIGKRARRPGSQANSVFLWGIANFFLIGRRVMSLADPSIDSATYLPSKNSQSLIWTWIESKRSKWTKVGMQGLV